MPQNCCPGLDIRTTTALICTAEATRLGGATMLTHTNILATFTSLPRLPSSSQHKRHAHSYTRETSSKYRRHPVPMTYVTMALNCKWHQPFSPLQVYSLNSDSYSDLTKKRKNSFSCNWREKVKIRIAGSSSTSGVSFTYQLAKWKCLEPW